jgi:ABC-2 type transport system ATP-binding protein
MSAIVVEDLVKRYDGFTAVEDVSFTAAAGEVTALLGPNGAGKTTTIEILEGFQAPTAGTVRVLGTDPRAGGRAGQSWRARIGLVLQSTSLDAQLTVTEALTLFGGLYSGRRRAGEVLDVIDMTTDARTRIGALSGGQRRRVDLGIAIIGQPEMLFLDEPTTGLDPEARRRLWSVIENLTASGTGVLLTTHYLDEAQRLASRVVVLADGRVVADASPDKLRAMGGVPVIRYRLPVPRPGCTAPDLPAGLAGHVADGELTLPSADVTADLAVLTGWARGNHVDLTGLEIGSPSLEDAYLALTSEEGAENRG